jgi:hypothetical protein
MNNEILDGEKQFFVTGVKTYLEADDAMTEFRRLVQHKCRTATSKRLDELNQACGKHWTVKELGDYFEKNDKNHYVGKRMEVKEFGGLYLCLRLSREDASRPFDAFVYLYRIRKDVANGLWEDRSGASAPVTYKSSHSLGFGRPLPEDKISDFGDYLDQAITDFLAFINDRGGLQKYLAQNVKLVTEAIR